MSWKLVSRSVCMASRPLGAAISPCIRLQHPSTLLQLHILCAMLGRSDCMEPWHECLRRACHEYFCTHAVSFLQEPCIQHMHSYARLVNQTLLVLFLTRVSLPALSCGLARACELALDHKACMQFAKLSYCMREIVQVYACPTNLYEAHTITKATIQT